ncbi:MAG: type II toxin-antitoxin system RelE/ParE family toxin [Oscillospiraceae bacterium]|nr:type II toxin-antitoxin system RelE/ParE family toxin [Oscillospiraceae bacterium]
MKYKAVYLALALKDVSEINSYLSRFYPDTPAKFLSALKTHIENLCGNPFVYAEHDGNKAYRKMVVLDYLVFYKVFAPEGIIEIHRVLYGMRDIKAYIP